MKHVITAYTMALFPRRARLEREPTGVRVGLADGGLELSVAGLAYRLVNAVEALALGGGTRLATLGRGRSLRQRPAPWQPGRTC